jgi:hypothetical protein
MISAQSKRYQIVLWPGKDRTGLGSKLQFDTLAEAVAEFDRCKAQGSYRSGVLFEWFPLSAQWQLIERF